MSLQITGLRFSYHPGKQVLQGLDLELFPGHLAAILGENGSGKTTLLKTINRLLEPTSGTVLIDGTVVQNLDRRQIARRFGYMPQRPEPAHDNVFEAVLLGRKAGHQGWTTSKDLEHVERVLRLVHLENVAMRPTAELSGGELQKVMLARALAQEPKVLLLDEPINHLDPVNQIEVMSLLRGVTQALGLITLVVTHQINNALPFADRFIFLKSGTVLAAGGKEIVTPATIREAFRIDVTIAEVDGFMVVVPSLHGLRPHCHIDPSGKVSEHTHEVDTHLYDHDHSRPDRSEQPPHPGNPKP